MYYHVSKIDLGSVVVFTPKIPGSSLISTEGNIPRVCVTTSIRNCLLSINGVREGSIKDTVINLSNEENSYRKDIVTIGPVTIYSTDQQPYLPPDASDFRINKEHWFIQPVEMKRIGYLSLGQLLKGKISLVKKPNQIVDYPKNNLPQKRF